MAAVIVGSFPALADQVVLACTTYEVQVDSAHPLRRDPFTFSVVIDRCKPAIVDVNGAGGFGWVIDQFSDTIIAAHYAVPGANGSLTINRITGAVQSITTYTLVPSSVVDAEQGTCVPAQRQF